MNNLHSVTSNAVAVANSDLLNKINYRVPRNVYEAVDWNQSSFTFDVSNVTFSAYRPYHIYIEYSNGTQTGYLFGLINGVTLNIITIANISGINASVSFFNGAVVVSFNQQLSSCNVYIERYFND